MSQERERFPIQPQERRESAKSFEDVRTPPEETIPEREESPPDKPDVPPQERHDRDEDDPQRDEEE